MKQNVLRKNLLLNKNNIDIGNVDPIFEARNKEGFITDEHPYVEVLEGSDEYNTYLQSQSNQELSNAKQNSINIRKTYLLKTDYKVIKSFENGEKLDENIAKLRQQARNEINAIDLIKTETQLTKLDNTIFTITTTE